MDTSSIVVYRKSIMIKKIFIVGLILSPLALPFTALASTTDGCNYYGYDCYTPSNTTNSYSNDYPYLGTYTNNNQYSTNSNYTFNPQPDPNALANSYAESHQTTSSGSNCNYYGYDCYTPSTTSYSYTNTATSTYTPPQDPNDIANQYVFNHPHYYSHNNDHYYQDNDDYWY